MRVVVASRLLPMKKEGGGELTGQSLDSPLFLPVIAVTLGTTPVVLAYRAGTFRPGIGGEAGEISERGSACMVVSRIVGVTTTESRGGHED